MCGAPRDSGAWTAIQAGQPNTVVVSKRRRPRWARSPAHNNSHLSGTVVPGGCARSPTVQLRGTVGLRWPATGWIIQRFCDAYWSHPGLGGRAPQGRAAHLGCGWVPNSTGPPNSGRRRLLGPYSRAVGRSGPEPVPVLGCDVSATACVGLRPVAPQSPYWVAVGWARRRRGRVRVPRRALVRCEHGQPGAGAHPAYDCPRPGPATHDHQRRPSARCRCHPRQPRRCSRQAGDHCLACQRRPVRR